MPTTHHQSPGDRFRAPVLNKAAIPALAIHPKSLWRVIRSNGTDTHGNRMTLCECQCQEQTRRSVRNADLKSGASLGCGCARSQRLWETNKGIKRNSQTAVVVSAKENTASQVADSQADTVTPSENQNAALTRESGRPTPTVVPLAAESADILFCIHGAFEADDLRLGTSKQCYACTRLRNEADVLKEIERINREDPDLTMARAMAPEGGKNFVTGGNDFRQLEFIAARRDIIERYGGKRRSAAGRDKIAPHQNPNFGMADDGDSPKARSEAHDEKSQAEVELKALTSKSKNVKGARSRMPKEFKGRHKNHNWKKFRRMLPDLNWVGKFNKPQ